MINKFFSGLRRNFLTGIAVAAPVTITAYMALTIINFFDASVKPWIPSPYNPDSYIPFPLPGVGLLLTIALLTILGRITASIFGYTILNYGEKIIERMPVLRNIYRLVKQIVDTTLSPDGATFTQVALVPFPSSGTSHALAFLASPIGGKIRNHIAPDEEMVSIFIPTAPNPTSGFLLFVQRKDLILLDISIEDAAKIIISAGIIVPESLQQVVRKDTQPLK